MSASVHQFPWFVSIRSQARNGLQSICGGSLIHPEVSKNSEITGRYSHVASLCSFVVVSLVTVPFFFVYQWVLTAAHCTHNYVSYNLGFGSNNLNAPLQSLTSTHSIEHLRYNPDTLNYDIAVIKLPEVIEYTAHIYAVRLPTLNQARQGQFHTTKARVCGYGRTSDGMTKKCKCT